jgi:hypothetical protein
MFRKILPVVTIIAIFLVACGQQAEPTLSPEEVSGTAVAAAWTIVAETQAAIPTNTPVPPTETPSPTPLPTFTLEPTPTLDVALPTATTASQTQGKCEGPLNVAEAGPQSNVRFENETGGTVTLSIHLGEGTNAFGQCGFLGYTLTKNQKLTVSLPKGTYFAFAYINYTNGNTGSAGGSFTNKVGDNHLFPVKIRADVIISK